MTDVQTKQADSVNDDTKQLAIVSKIPRPISNGATSWTPSLIIGSTVETGIYTRQAGAYITINYITFASFSIITNTLSSDTGNVGITLPVQASTSANVNQPTIPLGTTTGLSLNSGYTKVSLVIDAGTSTANIMQSARNNGSLTNVINSNLGSSTVLLGSLIYYTGIY